MLGQFSANPPLTALSATIGAATAALKAAQTTYVDAVAALIVPRVLVRYADHTADLAVRAAQRTAETADGVKGGKLVLAAFPDGVTPIVRPVGATQVTEMRALEGRLEAIVPLWPAAGAEKAKIEAERTTYEAALATRRTAMEKAADLRAKRDAAKEDFLDVYASTAARVKAEFPRNRPMQELFFDRIFDAVTADDDGDDDAVSDEDTAPTPATPT